MGVMDTTAILVGLIAATPLLTGNYVVYRLLNKTRDEVSTVKEQAIVAKEEAAHAHRAADESQTLLRGNGRGDIIKMVTQVQEVQSVQGYKLDSVLSWQGRHEARHEREASRIQPDSR